MKLVAMLFLVVACICTAKVLAEAKPGRLFEMARIRALTRRLAKVEAHAVTTQAAHTNDHMHDDHMHDEHTTVGGPTTVGPITPSAGLVALSMAQGVSLAELEALSPVNLALVQAAFDAGDFGK